MAESEREATSAAGEHLSAEVMLDMIIRKEDEIKKRISKAGSESERFVEEAKLEAAAVRREAATAEVGEDIRERELEKARLEAGRIAAGIAARTEEMRRVGSDRIEEAVSLLMRSILPPGTGGA